MNVTDFVPTGSVPRAASSALDVQIAGNHYKKWSIQPVEYIHANNIPFLEGNVIKYVSRWRDKGGIEDLNKARHYIDLLIELESKGDMNKAVYLDQSKGGRVGTPGY